ncbi:MAG: ABC transporter ATP-binding protein [Clostridiales bacterium]|nr:ABC transporter ATP-binding protein [Clostridiales bacterium]
MSNEIVRFSHVSMQFPGTLANDDISLTINQGEVFALVGENGAGKSTLMNLLYGIHRPTLGEIFIGGKPTGSQHSPEKAMQMGVSMVHQHFKLVPSFTVAQNILLGHEPKKLGLFYDAAKANAMVRELSETYGLEVNPTDVVRDLSIGLQQRVEILKALRTGAKVLILDEPTAVLTAQETEELFAVIRRIVREKQMTVIMITHRLPEVMQISDRVGVMRRGRMIDVLNTADTSEQGISSLMVGRDVIFDDLRTDKEPGDELLSIRALKAVNDRMLPALRGVSLSVRAGEIVGVCGVEGNGQTELSECIMGMRSVSGGSVLLGDKEITGLQPRQIRELGVSFIPEDRLSTGVDQKSSIAENLALGKHRGKELSHLGIHLRRGRVNRYAKELEKQYDIRCAGVDEPVQSLSGGNVQKVVIAREFSFDTPVLVICQPTRGVDIGAIEFIHEHIIEKRNQGCAILLISADLDELFRLSDTLVTLYDGQITGRFKAGEITMEEIGYYMLGAKKQEA